MGEGPTVELGEGDPKLRPLQKGQVDVVCTVNQVHLDYLIKNLREDNPGKDTRQVLGEQGNTQHRTCYPFKMTPLCYSHT